MTLNKQTKQLIGIVILVAIAIMSVTVSTQLQDISLKGFFLLFLGFIFSIVFLIINDLSLKTALFFSAIVLFKPLTFSIIPAVTLITAFGFIEAFANKPVSIKLPNAFFFFLLLVFGVLAYIKGAENDRASLYFFSTIVIPFLVVFAIYNSKLSFDDIKDVLRLNLLIAGIVGFIGVLIALTHPGERIGSTWVTAMTINGYYLINFFNGIGLTLVEKDKVKQKLFLVLTILTLLGMLFTYTRMALLAVFFGLVLAAFRFKQYRKHIIFGSILLFFIIPESMTSRVNSGIEGDMSTLVRLIAWVNSFKLIGQNFWTGIGIRTFSRLNHAMVPIDSLYVEHSHNIYIHILLELGIFGFISYFGIIFSNVSKFYFKIIRKDCDDFTFMFFVSIITIMFAGLTDIFIAQYNVSILFWICFGLFIKVYDIHMNKLHEEPAS